MRVDTKALETFWNSHRPLIFPEELEMAPPYCEAAAQFEEWAKEQVEWAQTQRTVLAINQVKVLIQDKYFYWRQTVTFYHRLLVGERGHRCIYWVWDAYYTRLR